MENEGLYCLSHYTGLGKPTCLLRYGINSGLTGWEFINLDCFLRSKITMYKMPKRASN